MVSVCIATYNGAGFIDKQIGSIINQLKQEDEIIISDDNSTDETITLIEAFADARIKVFKNKLKPGPVGNFENAITHAQGEIIFLADQDDIWMDNKVQEHLLLHEKFDLIVSNAVVTDEHHQVLFKSFFKARGSGAGLIKNIKRNSYIGGCMSFNKKIASAALPFPGDIHMHDWWIGLVAEVIGKIHFLDIPLMYYIRH